MKVRTTTTTELSLSLRAWSRQVNWGVRLSPARTSYNILYDVIHPDEPRSDFEIRVSKVNKIKAIYRGKALLGVIEYGYDKKKNNLWIHNLASSPNIVLRKTYKGIGSSLLLHAIKYAVRIGAKQICLFSSRDNFYRKFGFVKIAGMMVLRLCKKIIRKLFTGA